MRDSVRLKTEVLSKGHDLGPHVCVCLPSCRDVCVFFLFLCAWFEYGAGWLPKQTGAGPEPCRSSNNAPHKPPYYSSALETLILNLSTLSRRRRRSRMHSACVPCFAGCYRDVGIIFGAPYVPVFTLARRPSSCVQTRMGRVVTGTYYLFRVSCVRPCTITRSFLLPFALDGKRLLTFGCDFSLVRGLQKLTDTSCTPAQLPVCFMIPTKS